MNSEVVKIFVKKAVIKTIIFALIMSIIAAIGQSIAPIISNEMALTQMQNDNISFVLMNSYNALKHIIPVAYSLVTIWFVYTLGRDTYKFVNNMKNKDKKEN